MTARRQSFYGLQQTLRAVSGAKALRIIHPCDQQIAPHRHDWPFVALHRLGGYQERFEGEAHQIEHPSVVFHPAGRDHADTIGEYGLESITLEFDPAWLGPAYRRLGERSQVFSGPLAAGVARALQVAWSDTRAEPKARAITRRQLGRLAEGPARPAEVPAWMARAREAFAEQPLPRAAEIARRTGEDLDGLRRAWRRQTGEGLGEALRRRQVDRATRELRTTDRGLADIALAAGFCDQSHMNRVFRALVGRTPLQVRREAQPLQSFLAGEA